MNKELQTKNKCRLCNSEKISTLVDDRKNFPEFSILKCKECGLVFLEKRSTDKIKKIEDEYWQNNDVNINIYSNPSVTAEAEKRYKKYLKSIEKITNNKGKLLDFGCGIGNFIDFAAKNGWSSYGIDISSHAIECAKKRSLNVRQGDIEGSGLEDNFFDVITMWDVIEHLEDPAKTVEDVCKKLKTGGLLIIETPAEENIIRKLAWISYKISGGRNSLLPYFYYSVHKCYFSEKTITKMLKRLNMETISVFKELTLLSKAKLKLKAHKLPFKGFIEAILPAIFLLGNAFGTGNKIIVLARKKA